jgi:hypothetical protein
MQHKPELPKKTSRREFGKTAGVASAAFGFNLLPSGARGAIERPALAGIGSGGKGHSDIENARNCGFEIASLVDIVDAKKSDFDRRTFEIDGPDPHRFSQSTVLHRLSGNAD